MGIKKLSWLCLFCCWIQLRSVAYELNTFLEGKTQVDKEITQLYLLANYREGELKNIKLINNLYSLAESVFNNSENIDTKIVLRSLCISFLERDDFSTFLSSTEHPCFSLFEKIINFEQTNEYLEVKKLTDDEYFMYQREFVKNLVREGFKSILSNAEGFFSQIGDKIFWYPPLVTMGDLKQKQHLMTKISINPNNFILNGSEQLSLENKRLKENISDLSLLAKTINQKISILSNNSWDKYLSTSKIKLTKNEQAKTLSNLLLDLIKSFFSLEQIKANSLRDNKELKNIRDALNIFLQTTKYSILFEQETIENLQKLEKKLELVTSNFLLKNGRTVNLFDSILLLTSFHYSKEKDGLFVDAIDAIDLAFDEKNLLFSEDVFCLISLIASKTQKVTCFEKTFFVARVIQFLKKMEEKIEGEKNFFFAKELMNRRRLDLQNKFSLFLISEKNKIVDVFEMLSNQVKDKSSKKRTYLKGLILFCEILKKECFGTLLQEKVFINCIKLIVANILFPISSSINDQNFYDDAAILSASENCLLQLRDKDFLGEAFFLDNFKTSLNKILFVLAKKKAEKYCVLTECIKI